VKTPPEAKNSVYVNRIKIGQAYICLKYFSKFGGIRLIKKMLGLLIILIICLTGPTGCNIQTNALLAVPLQIENSSQNNSSYQEQSIADPVPGAEATQDNSDNSSDGQEISDEDTTEDSNEQDPIPELDEEVDEEPIPQLPEEEEIVTITINAAGDCTLGTDTSFGYSGSFPDEVKKNGYEYIFKNVKSIFGSDDLTIVNLETTLTNATAMASKKFRFKGSPDYTKIITSGSIEAVNIANNHIRDYLTKGYSDTVASLKNAGIGYFGYNNKYIKEIKGIRIGCLGYEGWNNNSSTKKAIKDDIAYLRKNGAKLIIVSFHWGEERKYYPNSIQKELGKYTIDSGADLVLGHHPHVVQGIQTYKGKNIVYSLGNFAFGGNRNPSDKDTFIYQQTFEFKNGQLLNTLKTNIIPCSVSSVKTRNNYQPTPLKGKEGESIISKIKNYSANLR
jgi:hypothetical protein